MYKLFNSKELKSLKNTIYKKNKELKYKGIVENQSAESINNEIKILNNLYKCIEGNNKY